MTLFEKIISIHPSLTDEDFFGLKPTVILQNDLDGKGDYIKSWNHPTLPRPTDEQLVELE